MKKVLATSAAVALLLVGCAPAQADTVRDVTSEPFESVAVGDVTESLPEVREALTEYDMRVVVRDTMTELLDASATFETSFEFERDILVCELLHQVPVDFDDPTYDDYPEGDALSDCVNGTIAAHEMYAE